MRCSIVLPWSLSKASGVIGLLTLPQLMVDSVALSLTMNLSFGERPVRLPVKVLKRAHVGQLAFLTGDRHLHELRDGVVPMDMPGGSQAMILDAVFAFIMMPPILWAQCGKSGILLPCCEKIKENEHFFASQARFTAVRGHRRLKKHDPSNDLRPFHPVYAPPRVRLRRSPDGHGCSQALTKERPDIDRHRRAAGL